jgi:hypothetical protein
MNLILSQFSLFFPFFPVSIHPHSQECGLAYLISAVGSDTWGATPPFLAPWAPPLAKIIPLQIAFLAVLLGTYATLEEGGGLPTARPSSVGKFTERCL